MRLWDWIDEKQIGSGVVVALVLAALTALFSLAWQYRGLLSIDLAIKVWILVIAVVAGLAGGFGLAKLVRSVSAEPASADLEAVVQTQGTSGLRVDHADVVISEMASSFCDMNSAILLASDFRTFSSSLSRGSTGCGQLKHAEVWVYALPFVQRWHPTLSARPSDVEEEWLEGLHGLLALLLDVARYPNLATLNLRVVSLPPALTGASLRVATANGSRFLILLHSVPLGLGASDTPAVFMDSSGGDEHAVALGASCAQLIERAGTIGSPMRFPIYRAGEVNYKRAGLAEFLARLTSVCAESEFALPTARFELELRVSAATLEEIGLASLFEGSGPATAGDVHRIFDRLRELGRTQEFTVEVDVAHQAGAISVGGSPGGQITVPVSEKHIVAAFVLLTFSKSGSKSVLLMEQLKRPWPFDVPGGKVALSDESLEDAAKREVFEELGLVLDPARLSAALESKYDRRSQKEGEPVIAVYFEYSLHPDEYVYLTKVLEYDAEGKHHHRVVGYGLDKMIAAKRERRATNDGTQDLEAECHAPLEAMEQVKASLDISRSV